LVWLTTDRNSAIPTDDNCARIGLILPRRDRRLQQFIPWAKKNLDLEQAVARVVATSGLRKAETERRLSHWWFYRGEIPPALFRSIDVLEGQPWWTKRIGL